MTAAEAAKERMQEEPSQDTEGSLLTTWRRIASDFLELAALELRLAGISLAVMVVMGLGAALLLVTAWLLIVAAIACWIMVPETAWAGTLAVIAVVNIAAAAVLVVFMKKRSRDLTFARTRRQIAPEHAPAVSPET